MHENPSTAGKAVHTLAWNAGRIPGAKRALKAQQVWAIRFWLQREGRVRDRALFDLAMTASYAAAMWSRCVPAMSCLERG